MAVGCGIGAFAPDRAAGDGLFDQTADVASLFAENRYPLFRAMLQADAGTPPVRADGVPYLSDRGRRDAPRICAIQLRPAALAAIGAAQRIRRRTLFGRLAP